MTSKPKPGQGQAPGPPAMRPAPLYGVAAAALLAGATLFGVAGVVGAGILRRRKRRRAGASRNGSRPAG